MRSIRSSSRGRTDAQRGFVLVIALVLAILYFMLMGLVMIDSSRAQAEAQRFRARMMAATLAEDAAERACAQMVTLPSGYASYQDQQGTITGSYVRKGQYKFEVTGEAETKGVLHQHATVSLEGHFDEADPRVIHIDYSKHSQ